MNTSTDGVTLYSSFVLGVLEQYRHLKLAAQPMFDLAKDVTPEAPMRLVPMKVYNDVCDWVEQHYGPASLREAGRAIGNTAYEQMVKDGSLGLSPTPNKMLEELKRVAAVMIQDPKRRGWEILQSADNRMRLRRTQSFNCMLQEGLLLSLVERTGAVLPRVNHVRCTRQGAEFCEYEVLWLRARAKTTRSELTPRPPRRNVG